MIRNVRLIDHTSYAISILQKTMSKVEERCWCNLKVDDMQFHVKPTVSLILPLIFCSETVLNRVIFADIDLTDGFVVSLQKISIVQHTIQQVWLSRSANDANVEIRATLRMEDVSIGFDVKTEMDNKITHTTGVMIYPLITFAFTISKHLFTDEITVRVVSEVVRTTNVMTFTPETDVTRVFTRLVSFKFANISIGKILLSAINEISSSSSLSADGLSLLEIGLLYRLPNITFSSRQHPATPCNPLDVLGPSSGGSTNTALSGAGSPFHVHLSLIALRTMCPARCHFIFATC
ncbi:uncharacterized protein LOC128198029 [Bicyclus anynana]|uniref:Uncharacterized protein LOC128198029 n=1 Tax=Bicyclus anynana TaxID=110368 RepID=A0ABM3LKH4_BICAN|nr:uncharacterized protein LOC128198029 [Bicyclus anynana]